MISLIQHHDLDRSLLQNPYTDLSINEIKRKWHDVQDLVPKRDGQLQQENHRQQSK